jgi:chemosensory pili system protein ChpA (sensor histidine kinase/response regulator)
MNNPLQNMPELRASFHTDSSHLIKVAADLLAILSNGDDTADASELRKTMHSLRGASAMIGAEVMTKLIDDFERLLEVAESFKLTAHDKAHEVYAFLQLHLIELGIAIQATLEDNYEEVNRSYASVHEKVLASWGEYFYPPAPKNAEPEGQQEEPPKAPEKPARASSRAVDQDAIAVEFLQSLGMTAEPATPAPAPEPEPAPVAVVSQPAPVEAPVAPPPVKLAEDIDPEMMKYFTMETSESLARLEGLVLSWEKTSADFQIAQSVFRLVHTIKGAANSLGLVRIGRLLHGLEDLLETHVVDRVFPRLRELVEMVLGVSDTIKSLVIEAQEGKEDPNNEVRIAELSAQIQAMADAPAIPVAAEAEPAEEIEPEEMVSSARSADTESVEAVSSRVEAEAVIESANTPEPEPAEAVVASAETPSKPAAAPERIDLDSQTIRVDSERLDLLMNLIGELVISRSRLEKKLTDISRLKEEMFFGKSRLFQAVTDFQGKYEYSKNRLSEPRGGLTSHSITPAEPAHETASNALAGFSELEFDQYDDFNILARTLVEIGTDTGEIFSQLNRFFDAFGEETGQFSKITARLQDEITRVRMIPLTLLFRRLQRAASDAARKESKEINFLAIDNDTRLDKLILDQLYTPLLHIVRNAVSHGVESKEARQKAGKNPLGQVLLRASCEANQVVIEVTDDGNGLDLEAIRSEALKRGLISRSEAEDDDLVTQCIFHPGFSTAAQVTDVSGRGVGLDVVRQEIARLSGSVHVRTRPGAGCTFLIHLPLTLAINQAMFITVGAETCALPLNFVERIQETQENTVTMSGQQELISTPEGMVPFLRLHQFMNVPCDKTAGTVVLARVADRRVAIGVDRILRKQDIVVKPLGPLLQGHSLFSGATLGGDGQVVMIIDLPRLLEHDHTAVALADSGNEETAIPQQGPDRPTILVVDDSLSVRKVIEKHLLSLQYEVELAVDGLDALEKLRVRDFSLVLTDLEMPRMHGFELIAEMRRQENLREIPVIVVTSRDAKKHRLRAMSLGADDYIIKPFSREQLAEHINQQFAKAVR